MQVSSYGAGKRHIMNGSKHVSRPYPWPAICRQIPNPTTDISHGLLAKRKFWQLAPSNNSFLERDYESTRGMLYDPAFYIRHCKPY